MTHSWGTWSAAEKETQFFLHKVTKPILWRGGKQIIEDVSGDPGLSRGVKEKDMEQTLPDRH